MKNVAIIINPESKMNHNYVAAVEAAGAHPVMIDYNADVQSIKTFDGIVITGGVDINPALYGEVNTDSVGINDKLDEFEMRVIDVAIKNKKPIFGTCRGHQLLNIFFGGTLIQNVEHCDIHKREGDTDKVHDSTVDASSFLYDIFGQEKLMINSAHHQAVKKLGYGLKIVQRSSDDVIEAFEHVSLPIYGVQWHPERTCLLFAKQNVVDGLLIFKWFVGKC